MSGGTGTVRVAVRSGVRWANESSTPVSVPPRTWPRVSKLELGPLPTAIGCARDHAKVVLAEWNLDHLVDDSILLVSELMTNALRASRALPIPTPIILRLLANDQQLVIEAWDQWVEGFDLKQGGSDDEHGRGLTVVTALSQRWGVGRIHDNYKVVWCELLVGNR
jgi:anti-sigma regulatory factor (Ser/Thr protein kinase)